MEVDAREKLQRRMRFNDSDLAANREGRLGDNQRRSMRRRGRNGVVLALLGAALIAALPLFGKGHWTNARTVAAVGFDVLIGGPLLVTAVWTARHYGAALADGGVVCYTGEVTLTGGQRSGGYWLMVADQRFRFNPARVPLYKEAAYDVFVTRKGLKQVVALDLVGSG